MLTDDLKIEYVYIWSLPLKYYKTVEPFFERPHWREAIPSGKATFLVRMGGPHKRASTVNGDFHCLSPFKYTPVWDI